MSIYRPLKIEKQETKVVVFTRHFKIIGNIHTPPGGRLSDFLNYNVNENPFIPMTNVTVYRLEDEEILYTASFLNLNRKLIDILLSPKEIAEE